MTTSTGTLADGHRCEHRVVVVSGYFNPLHAGHVRMIVGAAALGDHLVVVVNNDDQQLLKKGRIIIPLEQRLEVVRALRAVDLALAAVDPDPSIGGTLRLVRDLVPDADLVFANGGDRSSSAEIAEAGVCAELGIATVFAVGGDEKLDSSTRITAMVENA